MNEAAIHQTLEQTLSTWGHTKVHYGNTPPVTLGDAGQVSLWDGDEDFISISTVVDSDTTITLGNICTRIVGYLTIDINIKEGTGNRAAANYRDLLKNLLHYKTLGAGLRMGGAVARGPYNIRQGWTTHTVLYPFEAENSQT